MYSVTIKKDSLLVYVLKFFQILAGNNFSKFWRSSVVARERKRLGYERSGFERWVALFFLFIRSTLKNRSKFFQVS